MILEATGEVQRREEKGFEDGEIRSYAKIIG